MRKSVWSAGWVLFSMLSVSVVISAGSGCTTPPPPRKITVKERIEFDQAIGYELAQQMDPTLLFKKDPKVQGYLEKVAQLLADKTPDLHLPEVRIFLLQDDGRKWQSYALPGGRIYLSSDLIKAMEYENEIAALIAIQMGHLIQEHVLDYLRKNSSGVPAPDSVSIEGLLPVRPIRAPEEINFFRPKGIFSFSETERRDAVASAIDILYAAGYDSRGMIALLQQISKNPSRSAYGAKELEPLIELVRRKISTQAPLRNPIVRTDEFIRMRETIQKL